MLTQRKIGDKIDALSQLTIEPIKQIYNKMIKSLTSNNILIVGWQTL